MNARVCVRVCVCEGGEGMCLYPCSSKGYSVCRGGGGGGGAMPTKKAKKSGQRSEICTPPQC